MGIQGDITEVLPVTWNFPAWKKVETEISQLWNLHPGGI